MDEARRKTDNKLADLERRVSEAYNDPSFLRIEKKYTQYMNQVDKLTESDFKAYVNAKGDEKEKLRKVYEQHVKALTLNSKVYKDITKELTRVLATVNQKALDLINAEMSDIYAINYNQISKECKEIGIEVNGETE